MAVGCRVGAQRSRGTRAARWRSRSSSRGTWRGELQQAGERPARTDVSPEAIAAADAARCTTAFLHLPLGARSGSSPARTCRCSTTSSAHARRDDPSGPPSTSAAMLADWDVPTLLVDGWYDYPLPARARRLRRDPRRGRAGAAAHRHGRAHPGGGEGGMTDAPLAWFDTHLRGRARRCRPRPAGHRSQVQGVGGEWRDLPDWPPPHRCPRTWYLHADGRLSTDAPRRRRARALPLRPGRPDAVGRWHRHAHRRRVDNARARGARRRARVHE